MPVQVGHWVRTVLDNQPTPTLYSYILPQGDTQPLSSSPLCPQNPLFSAPETAAGCREELQPLLQRCAGMEDSCTHAPLPLPHSNMPNIPNSTTQQQAPSTSAPSQHTDHRPPRHPPREEGSCGHTQEPPGLEGSIIRGSPHKHQPHPTTQVRPDSRPRPRRPQPPNPCSH